MTTGDLATVDATSLTAGFQAELAQVHQTAKEWDAGAVLHAVTISWPTSLASGQSERVYIFGTPANTEVWWTLAINEQTQKRLRSLIPRSDYLGTDVPPVAQSFWQTNAVQALQTAETAGGTAFRTANPGALVTTSLIAQEPKSWLWWVVAYRGSNNQEHRVRIDAKTGQIYDEAGNPVERTNTRLNTTPTPTDTADIILDEVGA